MIEISFRSVVIVFTAIWLLLRVCIWVRGKRIDWKRELVLLLMYANLLFIIRYTFFPKALLDGHVQPLVFDAATAFPLRLNLVPLVNLFVYNSMGDLVWNVVGNAVMFLPTGILLPIVYKRLNNFWKVLAGGALISLCIEILQLPFSVRASDVDDLILNSLGVIIGYGIYALIRKITAK